MHCPKCGQQQLSDEIRYCSRCGFLLAGVAEVIANDGLLPGNSGLAPRSTSPRKRGVKQGTFIFLLSFLIVPIIILLSVAVNARPTLAVLATILLVAGGILRIAYALMFEEADSGGKGADEILLAASANFLKKRSPKKELHADTFIPAAAYAPPQTGTWRDTTDLEPMPSSVTESTTKLLDRKLHGQ